VKDFVAQVGKAHSEKEEDTDMANKVRTCLGEYRVGVPSSCRHEKKWGMQSGRRIFGACILRDICEMQS